MGYVRLRTGNGKSVGGGYVWWFAGVSTIRVRRTSPRTANGSAARRHCHVQHRWRCGNFHSVALAPPTMYEMPRNYLRVAGMAGIDKNATGKRGDGVAEPIHGVSP